MLALEDMDALGLSGLLVENLPAMVWRVGANGKCTYVNATWVAFTGRNRKQALGDGWLEAVHPDDVADFRRTLLQHCESQQPFQREFRLRRVDGKPCQILDRGAPVTDANGRFCGLVGTSVVIDEIVDREPSSYHLDDFFEMSLDNVCVAGLDGYFKRVNPSWTRTLGWTAQELLSRPSIEFVHPDDRAITLAGRERLRLGSELGPFVNRYLCKDGSHRWFEWRSVAHPGRDLVYAVARDVTEQKRAEQNLLEARQSEDNLRRQLIFADRMASVGTLAAGVAHEINNPLAYLISNVSLVREELENLEVSGANVAELKDMALEAQIGAERIRKIVRGLKTFSRAEEERLCAVDVNALLDLSINMTFNEIRQRARLVKTLKKVPPVEADDARLGQVFINLLVNAAQAIPEGHRDDNEIRVSTSSEQERVLIEIADTGVGMPEDLLDRIFEPFFTTKAVGVGTGLGLSICHNIVMGLGGDISVASQPGQGTCVRVWLPAAVPTAPDQLAAPAAATSALACASVLVVDDEPAIGAVLRRALRDHEVTVLTKAVEALELLRSGKSFDVILCDLMMPEMSGMDFYAELSRTYPHLIPRVVFVSGGAFTPSAHAFLDQISNERIEKPFEPARIRELVQRFLRERA